MSDTSILDYHHNRDFGLPTRPGLPRRAAKFRATSPRGTDYARILYLDDRGRRCAPWRGRLAAPPHPGVAGSRRTSPVRKPPGAGGIPIEEPAGSAPWLHYSRPIHDESAFRGVFVMGYDLAGLRSALKANSSG